MAEKITYGEQIRELRRATGFSARQFGEHLGVSESTIERWERDISTPEGASLTALYYWASESARPKLANYFIRANVLSGKRIPLLIQALPEIDRFFFDAAMALTRCVSDRTLTIETRLGFALEALNAIRDGRQFMKRISEADRAASAPEGQG